MNTLTAAYDAAVNGAGRSGAQILLSKAIVWHGDVGTPQATRSAEAATTVRLEPFTQSSPLVVPNAEQVPTVSKILIHGSQATADACDFSDVDVLVILDDRRTFSSDEHVRSIGALRRLLTSVYSFDSLMHHGLMWLPLSAFDEYDERFLPLETLRLSKVLVGAPDLPLTPQPTDAARSRQRVRAAATSIREQLARGQHLRGDYQLKNFVSGVLLLPSLLLAAHDSFVYKRRSFDLAQPHFSDAGWTFMTAAEEIRLQWIRPQDPWWKKAAASVGHPASHPLLSELIPSRLNVERPPQQRFLRALETGADLFFKELEAAVGQ